MKTTSLAFLCTAIASAVCFDSFAAKADSFRVRDPFVLTDEATGTYYLYNSTSWEDGTAGVSVRTGKDLEEWSEPRRVMTAPKGIAFVWAPEVHRYKGAYWMFATLKEPPNPSKPLVMMGPKGWSSKLTGEWNSWHATWIFRSERPEGPFHPVSDRPVTPPEWLGLDGTLAVEDGKPYLVFTHDWAQVADGTIELAPLTDDLTALAAPPRTLFRASTVAPGTLRGVTDGPFVYRSPKSGKLFITWSTHNPGKRRGRGYCVVSSESASGRLEGPWINHRIVSDINGGHGMVFRSLDGGLKFALHQPESWGNEHARFFDFVDDGEKLAIVPPRDFEARGRPAFKDGERVAFCGDSVTHHGYYVTPVQTFYYTRYPERDIQIFNCGVGGESSNETLWRFDKDIAEKRPSVVHVLLGMNDVCVLGYHTNASPATVARAKSAPERFSGSMRELKRRIDEKLPEASIIWGTPVPWDDELKFAKPRMPITGVTAAEVPLCETVRSLHREFGGSLVDYYTEMLAYNRKLHKRDPYSSLSPDTIHPKEPGGLFMTRLFLKAQGEDGLVSSTAIDVSKAGVASAVNATVSGLKVSPSGISFTLHEKALPFPVEPKARAIADELGFDDEFNRQILCVKGLAPGDWKLKIDGREICSAAAARWAEGVNLARYETPMMEHARKVAAMAAARRDREKVLRSMWCAYMVARRWLFGFGLTEDDFKDDRYIQAYARGYVRGDGGRKKGDSEMFRRFLENWPKRAGLEEDVEKAHAAVRKANRPRPHRFELAK